MVCHQIHRLQTLDLDPIEINHDLQHLSLGEIFEHKLTAQYRPLNVQLCDMRQLTFVLVLSYLHHHLFQIAYQQPSELVHMESVGLQIFHRRSFLHQVKFREFGEGNHQIGHPE